MAKVDPFTLRPPSLVIETKTFEDDAATLTLTFALRPRDLGAEMARGDLASSLIKRFLAGTPLRGDGGQPVLENGLPILTKEAPIPVQGQMPTLTPGLLRYVAFFMIAERAAYDAGGEAGELPKTEQQWFQLSLLSGGIFGQVMDWADALLSVRDDGPKAS